jgi:hypothetical protein
MIYIIDNGQRYDDHGWYFVESSAFFHLWFNTELTPEIQRAGGTYMCIVGVCDEIRWVEKAVTPLRMTGMEFVNHVLDDDVPALKAHSKRLLRQAARYLV